jgi:hypothetical protein
VDAEQQRCTSLRQQEQRRRVVVSKLDRGYEDFVSDRISEEFWTRKAQEWEDELRTVDLEIRTLRQPRALATVGAEKILELAKQAENLYRTQRPRNSADSEPFQILVKGNAAGNWRGVWDEFRNWAVTAG